MITPLFSLGQEIFYVWYDFSMEALLKDMPLGCTNNLLKVKPATITVCALENGKIYYGFRENPGARIGEKLITTDQKAAEEFVKHANAETYQFRKYFYNHCNLKP